MEPIKIIFICQGNICRSPAAMFLLRHKLSLLGLGENYVVTSAGLENSTSGQDMHQGSKDQLDIHHIPYAPHSAHKLSVKEYLSADYVITMENVQKIYIKRMMSGSKPEKLHRLLDFCGEKKDIADPFYTGDFAKAYEDISRGVDGFIASVVSKKN